MTYLERKLSKLMTEIRHWEIQACENQFDIKCKWNPKNRRWKVGHSESFLRQSMYYPKIRSCATSTLDMDKSITSGNTSRAVNQWENETGREERVLGIDRYQRTFLQSRILMTAFAINALQTWEKNEAEIAGREKWAFIIVCWNMYVKITLWSWKRLIFYRK